MLRYSLLSCFVCSWFFAGASAGGAPQPKLNETGYLQRIVQVKNGVWLLAQPKFQVQPNGNVTIIEQKDGLVLIDAGNSKGAGERIVDMVRSVSPKPVKAVVISQWHGDKPQGLSEILKAWPDARTISTVPTQQHLSDPVTMNTPGSENPFADAKLQAQLQSYENRIADQAQAADSEEMRRHYQAFAVDVKQWAHDLRGATTLTTKEAFTESMTIGDPDAPIEILYLGRANTDGDAVVWLPRQRIVVAGETVILPFPYGFESYPADWIAVLDRIRKMPFDILIPGHGMPQNNRGQIDKIAAALKNVRAQVAPLVAQGLTLAQVQAKVNLSSDEAALVGNDPWLRKWFKNFWADPIVVSSYKEAKGEPIVQSLQ